MPYILDVRTKEEFEEGHVSSALHFPLDLLEKGSLPQVAKDTPIITYCAAGVRAGKAKAILEHAGFTDVTNGTNQATVEKSLATG